MNEQTQEIIHLIKQSKKYKHLSEEIIKQKLEEYIKRNPNYQDYKEKFILKEIKSLLHQAYGSFQAKNKNKSEKYLEKLRNQPKDLSIIKNILATNNSTKERLPIYKELYKQILQLTGKPSSIADLGCGFNPFSYYYLNLNPNSNAEYHAYDIGKYDLNLINEFFKIENINGKAEILDLSRIENYSKIKACDLCFMFKFIDTIEKNKKGHKFAEEIINFLIEKRKCKFIIASFPTKTLCNRQMNHPYRGWIERMLTRINMQFKMLEFENEIFYIISK